MLEYDRDRLPSDLHAMSFTTLQGKLLIASPALLDPNFVRTVVLITEHSEEAAMGLVLNRPTSIAVRDAVPILAELVDAEEPVYEGGPVQPEAVVALAEFDDPNDSAAIAFGRIGFLRADEDPGTIRTVEQHVRVFCGYAGWGAGQLEDELEQEAWIVAPALAADLFPGSPDLWRASLRRLGGRHAMLALMPDDPSSN
jgi:putative transcriptional regulator